MVVTQVVEQSYSVQQSRVQIPGRTRIFLFLFGVRQSLTKTVHKKCYELCLLLSCFQSFKHCKYINCNMPMNQRKENKKSPKETGKGPNLKKNVLTVLCAMEADVSSRIVIKSFQQFGLVNRLSSSEKS